MEQNTNLNKLLHLVKENPDLPVIPFVNWEIPDEDWGYWLGSIGDCIVDEICLYKNRYYFRSDISDLEEQLEDDYDEKYNEFADGWDEYIKAEAQKQEWIKVIVLKIELP